MKPNCLRMFIISLFFSISTLCQGCPEPTNSLLPDSHECERNLELFYPTSFEGVTSSLMYWSMYPLAWIFGVEGLLLMVPSRYPNGTVRSWGG